MIFKIKRKTTRANYYTPLEGTVNKPTTKIKLSLFGLISIKTLHRYRQEYDGKIVSVDKNNNIINDSKIREKALKAKLKHAQTRDFVIGNLELIKKVTDDDKTKKIAQRTIDELKENESYMI